MGTRWQDRYAHKIRSADQALAVVNRGSHVFVGSGCAEPQSLVAALARRAEELADTEIIHILTLGIAPYADPKFSGRFRHNAFFIGANVRDAVLQGEADYTPIFLSEVPGLIRRGRVRIDVALVHVSCPDEHGYCSFGVAVDVVKAAAETARVLIAEVNPRMPRTHGDSFISVDCIDYLVESDQPIPELPGQEPDEVSLGIARFIADLVEPGATLQLGIGRIPNAVLSLLSDKEDLGLHTEMFSDGVLPLIRSGVINNRRKTLHRGKTVAAFCMGSRALYDFVDDNPAFEFHPCDYTNDPVVIGRNDNMVAINSALQVDLTGQVCADSIGHRFYSGIGGQVDFIRGAARSRGGKPVIALPSTAKGGKVSRIVPVLNEGAGIVTSRADVYYVVTEYGAADLHGRTIRERALALISIAHPDVRGELLAAAKARHYVYPQQIPFPEKGRPYPKELERWGTFAHGLAVFFRPLKPDDERLLRDLFYSHSEETIYLRYHMPLKRLSLEQIQRFVTLDYRDEMAIGGFIRAGDIDQMIAVGRYFRDRKTNFAEAALTVHDDYQGRGIGTFLLDYLIEIGAREGLAGFTAQVLTTNRKVLDLFYSRCSPLRSKLTGNVIEISFRFDELQKPPTRPTTQAPTPSS